VLGVLKHNNQTANVIAPDSVKRTPLGNSQEFKLCMVDHMPAIIWVSFSKANCCQASTYGYTTIGAIGLTDRRSNANERVSVL